MSQYLRVSTVLRVMKIRIEIIAKVLLETSENEHYFGFRILMVSYFKVRILILHTKAILIRPVPQSFSSVYDILILKHEERQLLYSNIKLVCVQHSSYYIVKPSLINFITTN